MCSKGSQLICCSEELQRKIESQLALCEFSMQKSVQVYKMNEDEQKNYEKLNKDIGNYILKRHRNESIGYYADIKMLKY